MLETAGAGEQTRGGMAAFDPDNAADYPAVIGCDEVGRGALSGPVVVAAVWFDPRAIPPELLGGLDDSKRLVARRREELTEMIMACAGAKVALAASAACRIDREGIRLATLDAMRRAVERLRLEAPIVIDGVDVPPGLALPASSVVRGDSTVPQIAAASIVAKTCRDRLMGRLAQRHPAYGWTSNVGYGTPEHLAALDMKGPTRHHRQSFAPVSQLSLLAELA